MQKLAFIIVVSFLVAFFNHQLFLKKMIDEKIKIESEKIINTTYQKIGFEINQTSKYEKQIEFARKVLGINPNIEIEIILSDQIIRDAGVLKKGGCTQRDSLHFEITLFEHSLELGIGYNMEATKIIFHECIHIWQIDQGKLKPLTGGWVIWKGEKFNVLKMRYEDRPWEIEARYFDSYLMTKWDD